MRKLNASAGDTQEVVVVEAFDKETEEGWVLTESMEDMQEHEADMGDMELDVEEVFICSNKGLLAGNSMDEEGQGGPVVGKGEGRGLGPQREILCVISSLAEHDNVEQQTGRPTSSWTS